MTARLLCLVLGCCLIVATLNGGCSRKAPQVALPVESPENDTPALEFETIRKLPSVEPGDPETVRAGLREPTPDLVAGQTLQGNSRVWFGTRTHPFGSAQFTPEGLRLVGGGYGPAVFVWDLKTGEESSRLLAHKEGGALIGVQRAFLSPDGATVLTSSSDFGELLLWDLAKTSVRHRLKTFGGLRRAVFSADSKTLFILDNNNALTKWDAQSRLATTKSGKLEAISSDGGLVLTPEGKTLILAGEKGDIILFDSETLHQKKRWNAHKRSLHGLALSPDGKTLATIAFDEGLLRLWDLEKATEIRSTKYDRGLLTAVAFSPSGKFLAAGGSSITLWEVKTGAEMAVLHGYSGNVGDLAFSPDGSLLAATPNSQRGIVVWELTSSLEKWTIARGGRDDYLALATGGTRALLRTEKGAELRDLTTGKILWTVLSDRLSTPTFSPDGKLFAYCKTGDKVTLIDAATGIEKATIESSEPLNVQSLLFRPDGKRLAICNYSDVRMCDLGGDKPKVLPTPRPTVRADSLAYNPTGKSLAVGDGPNLRLLDAESGKVIWSVPAHEGVISTVTFSPDGTHILTVSRDRREGAARLWNAADGKPVAVFRHDSMPLDAFFSEEGQTVITFDDKSNLHAWDAVSGKLLGKLLAGESSPRFAADRKMFFTTSDKKLHLWETTTFTRDVIRGRADLIRMPEEVISSPVYAPGRVLKGPGEAVDFCAFSADGKRMVSVNGKQGATVWDVEAARSIRSFALETGPVELAATFVAALSADGKTLAIGCRDGAVRLVDVETGKETHKMTGHKSFVRSVAFSPDGKSVASGTGGFDETELFLWNATTGMKVKEVSRGGGMIDSLVFTPDGKTLVVSANNGGVRLFEVESGRERPKLVHPENVDRVAVSPDGTMVAAGGGFSSLGLNDVTVWDLTRGKLLRTLTGQRSTIDALAFGTDGLLVVRGGGTYLWNAKTGKRIRHLPEVRFRALSPDGRSLVAETSNGLESIDVTALRDDRLQNALGPVLRLAGIVKPAKDGLGIDLFRPSGPDSVAAIAGLEQLPELRALTIDSDTMPPAQAVESIVRLKSLRSLTINASDLTDAQVARLADLSGLTALDLSNGRQVTVPGFAVLAKLTKLEALRLRGTQMTAAGLAPLVGAKNLRSLDLSQSAVGGEGLEVLAKFSALTDLNLGSGIEDKGLEKLQDLTKLRSLLLEGADISDVGLAHLGKMSALENLDLSRTKISDAGLVHLKAMTNLKTLNLANTSVTDAGFSHLSGLTKLTSIGLTGLNKLTGTGLQHLHLATELTKLSLDGTGVTDAGIVGLKDWTHLVVLELPETTADAGLLHLAKLTKLQSINLARLKGLKGPGLAGLKDATSIVALDLRNLSITDVGLEGLKDWKQLVKLELPRGITDAGLARLAGLSALKTLDLEGATGITDVGLAHVKGLTNLESLILRGTKITDAGLVHLEGLVKLVRLNVGSTGVTDAGIRNLEKKLPKVDVWKF